ncbi:MAG TPA: peptide chain release factor N(5)-glutamine methyltransferase [Nitrospirales bacterium]|jgi:release factor glutamine methyltransferase
MIALPAAPALSIRQLRIIAREALKAAGLENAEQETEWLLADALRLTHGQLIAFEDRPLTSIEAGRASKYIDRRAAREPLQYILGTQEFCGLEIAVDSAVLIPRPETELVVEEAAQVIATGQRSLVADIGTGSGCIAIALAKARPLATIVATDISWPALVVGRRNAGRYEVENQVKFLAADLLEPFEDSADGIFDALVSNPPYIPEPEMEILQPEVARYEPWLALVGGLDGLAFYRRLLSAAPLLLKPGGHLIVELGMGQAQPVSRLAETRGLPVVRCRKDHAGIERVLVLRRPA